MLETPVKFLEEFKENLIILDVIPSLDNPIGGDTKFIIVIEPDQLPMIGHGVHMYNAVMNPNECIDVSILYPPDTLFISPSGFAIKTNAIANAFGRMYTYIRETKDIPDIHISLLNLLGIKLDIQQE